MNHCPGFPPRVNAYAFTFQCLVFRSFRRKLSYLNQDVSCGKMLQWSNCEDTVSQKVCTFRQMRRVSKTLEVIPTPAQGLPQYEISHNLPISQELFGIYTVS